MAMCRPDPASAAPPSSCVTPPSIHKVMLFTVALCRRATTACAASWAIRQTSKQDGDHRSDGPVHTRGETFPGSVELANSAANKARMTSTDQCDPTGIPLTRPSRMLAYIPRTLGSPTGAMTEAKCPQRGCRSRCR
jgi:hypothetical protein